MTDSDRPVLVERLRQRHIIQALVIYVGVAWGLAQVAEFAVDNYELSRRLLDVTLFLLIVGLPAVAVVTWFHGEKGHQRIQRSEAAILAGLIVIAAAGSWLIGSREVSEAAERDLSAVVDLGDQSVAVLPFGNNLSDPDLAWLSAGSAELLTTGLAEIPSIRVVSGQRLFDLLRQEGRDETSAIPSDLATRLTRRAGARYMVNGALYGTADNLQIRADLVDVADGTIAGSSRARGADVFALIDSVAADLAGQIRGGIITTAELTPVTAVTSGNLEAYRHYLEGIRAQRRFRNAEALESFRQAVALDSTFALAQMRLSGLARNMGQLSISFEAMQAAGRHRALAPERDRLYIDAIFASAIDNDVEEGKRLLGQLLARYPDDTEARAALWRLYDGRSEERARLLREAIALDPFDGVAYNELAYFEARQGNFEAADSLIQRYIELEPGEPNPLDSRGEIFMMAGRHPEAREQFRLAIAAVEGFEPALRHLAESYIAEGRFREGIAELQRLARDAGREAATPTYQALAQIQTAALELDDALATLSRAIQSARSTGDEPGTSQALTSMLPILVAQQEWDEVRRRSADLLEADPSSPFPFFADMIAHAEQGSLGEAEAIARQMREFTAADPGLARFAPQMNAAIDHDLEFYRGNFANAVAAAERLRELGGWPELGSYSEVRSLLALGRGEEAARRARWMGSFTGASDALVDVHQSYFVARGHEAAGDTASALAAYGVLLDGPRESTAARVPLLADARARRDRLRAGS